MRVHELAKELGMTNKEMVDLTIAMGIDVKSHSSTLIEAQADRVRRRAAKDGLIRDQQPEEPPKATKGGKKAAAPAADKPAEADKPVADKPAAAEPAPAPAPAPAADQPAAAKAEPAEAPSAPAEAP